MADPRGPDPEFDPEAPLYEPVRRLNADFRQAAATLSAAEVRYLIDMYYVMQEDRKRSNNQLRAASIDREPNRFLSWVANQVEEFEGVCKSALVITSRQTRPGRWCNAIFGVGPVLTAGLIANLDITRAPYPSSFHRFAGLDPSRDWLGKKGAEALYNEMRQVHVGDTSPQGLLAPLATRARTKTEFVLNMVEKQTRKKPQDPARPLEDVLATLTRAQLVRALATRPWNAQLKVLQWKTSESFTRIAKNPKDMGYGKRYLERKEVEWERNLRGAYVQQATAAMARDLTADQRAWYGGSYHPDALRPQWEKGVLPSQWDLDPQPGKGQPMLPPGRIELRARRIAVKHFLGDLHYVLYDDHYGHPPPQAPGQVAAGRTWAPPPQWPID